MKITTGASVLFVNMSRVEKAYLHELDDGSISLNLVSSCGPEYSSPYYLTSSGINKLRDIMTSSSSFDELTLKLKNIHLHRSCVKEKFEVTVNKTTQKIR